MQLTTTVSDDPLAADLTYFVMECALEGVLCRLHFDGSATIVARFKYKGQGSGLDCTDVRAAEYV
jgi:hypothetical protein